jgi:hypothetical protein
MPARQRLIDFFELRPCFTLWSLCILWWLYIFYEVEKLFHFDWFRIIAGPAAPSWFLASGWSNAFFTLLRVVVLLAVVRLLLDVLLKFVMPSRDSELHRQRTWVQDALAFFDLRPFYTRWWLQVLWWLFLLSVLRTVYILVLSYISLWSPARPIDSLYRFAVGMLGPLTWTAGVRLLIEAALISHSRDSGTATP